MNGISKLDNNTGATSPTSYMQDAYVYQLGRGATIASEGPINDVSGAGPTDSANVLRAYRFIDVFPTNVSEIASPTILEILSKNSPLNSKFNTLKDSVLEKHFDIR